MTKRKEITRARGRETRAGRKVQKVCNLGETIDHPHGCVDPNKLYDIRAILRETRDKYEIQWADAPNGETYELTREPKRNVTKLAAKEWKSQRTRAPKECSEDGVLWITRPRPPISFNCVKKQPLSCFAEKNEGPSLDTTHGCHSTTKPTQLWTNK